MRCSSLLTIFKLDCPFCYWFMSSLYILLQGPYQIYVIWILLPVSVLSFQFLKDVFCWAELVDCFSLSYFPLVCFVPWEIFTQLAYRNILPCFLLYTYIHWHFGLCCISYFLCVVWDKSKGSFFPLCLSSSSSIIHWKHFPFTIEYP